MSPTRTEIVLALLDDVLAEKYGGDKTQNLRRIEHAAKRMADQIERLEHARQWTRAKFRSPSSVSETAPSQETSASASDSTPPSQSRISGS